MTDTQRATDDERADQIRARADAATRPPWSVPDDATFHDAPIMTPRGYLCTSPDDGVRGSHDWPDAQFIAAARSDVPWLLDRLAAATAEVERLREDLASYDMADRLLNPALYGVPHCKSFHPGDPKKKPMDWQPLCGRTSAFSIKPEWADVTCADCFRASLAAETKRADKAEAAVSDARAENEALTERLAFAHERMDAGLNASWTAAIACDAARAETGRRYYLRGRPVQVVTGWGPGATIRNVRIRYLDDDTEAVRPFRGLRRDDVTAR